MRLLYLIIFATLLVCAAAEYKVCTSLPIPSPEAILGAIR